jgi:2-haloacid dehalogenase
MSANASGQGTRPRVLAFDLNQTLVDFGAARPAFAQLFGDGKALDDWFTLLLHSSLVVTLTDSYVDFRTLGRAALKRLVESRGVGLTEEDCAALFTGLSELPAHPDVPAALEQLQKAGFRMAVLTNSPAAGAAKQIENAGIAQYFEDCISVDIVKKFKPAPEVYRAAAARLGVAPCEMMLVAAHGWDVYGALRAGCRAAFIARAGQTLFPVDPRPEILAPDLRAFAAAVLEE